MCSKTPKGIELCLVCLKPPPSPLEDLHEGVESALRVVDIAGDGGCSYLGGDWPQASYSLYFCHGDGAVLLFPCLLATANSFTTCLHVFHHSVSYKVFSTCHSVNQIPNSFDLSGIVFKSKSKPLIIAKHVFTLVYNSKDY